MRSEGLLKNDTHASFSLRMLKAYYLTIMGERLPVSLPRLMNWGIIVNGKCLTANISFHKTGNVSSLSDILEKEVDEKYFLSEKMTRKLVEKTT